MPTDEEPKECDECKIAALGGVTLSMCRELESHDVDCEQLAQRFIDGELSIKDLVETVRAHTQNRETLGKLEEIETLARGDE